MSGYDRRLGPCSEHCAVVDECEARGDVIKELRAENERLREAFSNLKSIFRVNMLRAFPETSHEVIDGYIVKALGETE